MEITPEQVRRDLQTVKKKLNTAAVLQDAIDSNKSRLTYLKGNDAQTARATIQSLTHKMEQAVAEMVEVENRYMNAILRLKPLYQTVILDYYINGIPMRQISNRLHYDDRTLYRIVGKAINEIAKSIEKADA